MSADNGIYILKTKDQYRVAHLSGIDNVTWSLIDGDWNCNDKTRGKLVPTRVVEMWGDCKYTKDRNKAFEIAHKWAANLPICEYGVNIITYNKTWKHILEDAKEYANKEITHIKETNQNEWYKYKLDILQRIVNGEYL